MDPLSTGLNHIDLDYCKNNDIKVLSQKKDYELLNDLPSTSELAFGLMLSILRNIPNGFDDVKKGGWDYDKFIGHQLKGKTIAPDVTVTNQLLPTNFNDCVRVVEKAIQSVISHNGIKRVVSPKSKIPSIVRIESIAIPRAAGSNSCWILMISMKTNIAE